MNNYVTNHIICAEIKFKTIDEEINTCSWYSYLNDELFCIYGLKFDCVTEKKKFTKLIYNSIKKYY